MRIISPYTRTEAIPIDFKTMMQELLEKTKQRSAAVQKVNSQLVETALNYLKVSLIVTAVGAAAFIYSMWPSKNDLNGNEPASKKAKLSVGLSAACIATSLLLTFKAYRNLATCNTFYQK